MIFLDDLEDMAREMRRSAKKELQSELDRRMTKFCRGVLDDEDEETSDLLSTIYDFDEEDMLGDEV